MSVVYAPNATQGARLVVDDVNCQAVCNPDGSAITGTGAGNGNVTIFGETPALAAKLPLRVVDNGDGTGSLVVSDGGEGGSEIGVYNTTFPTLTNGESTQAQTNVNGVLYVIPSNPVGAANGPAITNQTVNNSGTTTLAARPTRRSVTIICPAGSAETIYFGPATGVNATTGAAIPAGSSISLETTSALFFFGTAGTGSVTTVEIYD